MPLFIAAAMFQLFDGLQVAAIGALRGLGDTRSALYWNFVGYWLIALPIGYLLCFHRTATARWACGSGFAPD